MYDNPIYAGVNFIPTKSVTSNLALQYGDQYSWLKRYVFNMFYDRCIVVLQWIGTENETDLFVSLPVIKK